MKTPIEALLVVAALFVQGCATYVPGVEKTDLSAVYEETATRSEIEAVLGEPVAARTTDEGSISIYKYNKGAEGGAAGPDDLDEHPVFGFLLMFTAGLSILPATPFLYADKFDSQKGFMAVFYSADDDPTDIHLVGLVGSGDPDTQMDGLVAGLELKRRADEGDVEAMYQYASRINDKAEAWKLNCLAANQNHPDAQFSVAMHHRWGFDPVEQDVLRAYVWFRLAELNGYEGQSANQQKPYSEVLADNMTPSELADGERLVSKWKPNPAECEGEAKLAAD